MPPAQLATLPIFAQFLAIFARDGTNGQVAQLPQQFAHFREFGSVLLRNRKTASAEQRNSAKQGPASAHRPNRRAATEILAGFRTRSGFVRFSHKIPAKK